MSCARVSKHSLPLFLFFKKKILLQARTGAHLFSRVAGLRRAPTLISDYVEGFSKLTIRKDMEANENRVAACACQALQAALKFQDVRRDPESHADMKTLHEKIQNKMKQQTSGKSGSQNMVGRFIAAKALKVGGRAKNLLHRLTD